MGFSFKKVLVDNNQLFVSDVYSYKNVFVNIREKRCFTARWQSTQFSLAYQKHVDTPESNNYAK